MLEKIDVTISGEPHVFTAYADRSIRWNGWLACPRFDRDNANRIAAWVNEENAYDNGETATLADWADDVLFITDNPGDGELETTTRIAPDDHGRYAIGAYAWCWTEVDDNEVAR